MKNKTEKNQATLAQNFKARAMALMPQHDDLQDLEDYIDSASRIDEIMFAKGEYIGGMASVILALLEKE
jgi:hypothetical protein